MPNKSRLYLPKIFPHILKPTDVNQRKEYDPIRFRLYQKPEPSNKKIDKPESNPSPSHRADDRTSRRKVKNGRSHATSQLDSKSAEVYVQRQYKGNSKGEILENALKNSVKREWSSKVPQYSKDFFKEPGVVPGSSNFRKPRNQARKRWPEFVLDESIVVKSPRYYQEKEQERRLQEEIKEVRNIDNWEDSLRRLVQRRAEIESRIAPKKPAPSKKK